jgi:hypothetical protein
MINKSLTMVEDIREKHFDEDGELIITQAEAIGRAWLEN